MTKRIWDLEFFFPLPVLQLDTTAQAEQNEWRIFVEGGDVSVEIKYFPLYG